MEQVMTTINLSAIYPEIIVAAFCIDYSDAAVF